MDKTKFAKAKLNNISIENVRDKETNAVTKHVNDNIKVLKTLSFRPTPIK